MPPSILSHRRNRCPRTMRGSLFAACSYGLVMLPACDTKSGVTSDIDALPRLTATADLRIGSTDDPELGFSRLGSVDIDDEGNVYALEVQDYEIRVFSPDGRLVRRIGRRGGGPGEFQMAPRFGVVGDTLWTYDAGGGRITLFDRTGTVMSTGPTHGLRIPLAQGYGYVLPTRMRPDGLFTGWLSRVSGSARDAPTGVYPGDSIPVPRVVFDATGAVVDTIGWLPSPPPRMVPPPGYDRDRYQRITVGSRQYFVPDPPTTLPTWLALDDGHIVVDVPYAIESQSGAFTVTRINLSGDTVYHRVLNFRPGRFTPEELDSVAARAARGSGLGPAAPESEREVVANALRAALKFPAFRLPILYPWLAQDESVWLARDDGEAAAQRWVILRRDGQTRGELHLPSNVRPLWSRDDTVWVAELDALEVPWLVRYRIGS